jgi:hypothetical protein
MFTINAFANLNELAPEPANEANPVPALPQFAIDALAILDELAPAANGADVPPLVNETNLLPANEANLLPANEANLLPANEANPLPALANLFPPNEANLLPALANDQNHSAVNKNVFPFKPFTKLNKKDIEARLEYLQKLVRDNGSEVTTWRVKADAAYELGRNDEMRLCMERSRLSLDVVTMLKTEIIELRKLQLEVKRYKLQKETVVKCEICQLEAKGFKIPNSPIKICLNCIYSAVLEHHTIKGWKQHADECECAKVQTGCCETVTQN